MLKMTASGTYDGRPTKIIILGLSHTNLSRLKVGQPITFAGEDVSIAGTQFIIFSGESEQSMARELADLVGPETKVRIDPKVRDA